MRRNRTILAKLSLALTFIMLFGFIQPLPAVAEGENLPPTGAKGEIISFAEFEDEIAVSLGTAEADLPLPETLVATVRLPETATPTEVAGTEIEVDVPVTWISAEYDGDTLGEYVFTAVISDDGYFATIALPQIAVTVEDLIRALRLGSSDKFLAPIVPITDLPDAAEYIPVSNRAELEAIKDNLSGKYYLTQDINLSGAEWVPIGDNYLVPFTGTFDGQGYAILNITITGNIENAGLFGSVSGDVKNLGSKDGVINTTGDTAGSIAGTGSISNCYSTGSVTVSSTSIQGGAGGIVGSGNVVSCYNTGNVTFSSLGAGHPAFAGGITGSGNAESCYNTGDVSAISDGSTAEAGGIAGRMGSGSSDQITNCYNTGDVSASTTGTTPNAGGIAGHMSNSGRISNCYNVGNVNVINNGWDSSSGAGGIAGGGSASGSGINGNITIESNCIVTNCAVMSSAIDKGGSKTSSSALIFSVNVSDLSGRNNIARTGISGGSVNDATQLLPLSDFHKQSTYSALGWDFENVWEMLDGHDFPQLRTNDVTGNGGGNDDILLSKYSIVFPGLAGNVDMDVLWGWDLFKKSATTYDNRLAIVGCALSAAAEKSQDCVEDMLDTLGFEWISSFNYDDNQVGQIAYSIASKKVQFNRVDYNLYVIVNRGTTSAADIITDISKNGFDLAANEALGWIEDYVDSDYGESLDAAKQGNNIFFVTGHSLGGAVANLLGGSLLFPYATREKIYTYTFASPYTWSRSWMAQANVHNTLNKEDFVTGYTELFSNHANKYRIGIDRWFSSETAQQMNSTFSALTNGQALDNYIEGKWYTLERDKIWRPHYSTVYMAYLLARSEAGEIWKYDIRVAAFKCPVDVDVFNTEGELVGRVVDNVVDTTIPLEVFIAINGDEKYIYMPFDEQYTFRLSGTDNGTMQYSVMNIDLASNEVETQKDFNNVNLFAGKRMLSESGGNIDVVGTKLYVVDGNTAKIAEIQTNGTEIPIGNNGNNSNSSSESDSGSGETVGATTHASVASLPKPVVQVTTAKSFLRVIASRLNVRSSPSIASPTFGKLTMNTVVEMLEKTDSGWAKILLSDGSTGWVSMRYTVPIAIATEPGDYLTTANLRVRKGASTLTATLAILPKGSKVTITGQLKNGFAEVPYNGSPAYVHASYLVPID